MAATVTPKEGAILHLNNTPAYSETANGDLTDPTTLTGRFVISDFTLDEPSAHQEAGVIVVALNEDLDGAELHEQPEFFISADVFADAWDKSAEVSPRLTLDECGCYLDGQRGHYLTRDTIEFAQRLGFSITAPEELMVRRYALDSHDANYPHDALHALCDSAVEWLNENIAPEGASFGFNDGLYLLTSDAWEAL